MAELQVLTGSRAELQVLNDDVIYHLLMLVEPLDLNQVSRSIPSFRRVRNWSVFQRAYQQRWLPQLTAGTIENLLSLAVFRRGENSQLSPEEKHKGWFTKYMIKWETFFEGLECLRQHQDYGTILWILTRYPRRTDGLNDWVKHSLPPFFVKALISAQYLDVNHWLITRGGTEIFKGFLFEYSELDYTRYLIHLMEQGHLSLFCSYQDQLPHNRHQLYQQAVVGNHLFFLPHLSSNRSPNLYLPFASSVEIAQFLIQQGAEINGSILIAASGNGQPNPERHDGYPELVRYYLSRHTFLTCHLEEALEDCWNEEIIELLCEAGATDPKGEALRRLVCWDQVDLFWLLLRKINYPPKRIRKMASWVRSVAIQQAVHQAISQLDDLSLPATYRTAQLLRL